MMRDRDNYFAGIEQAAAQALAPVSYSGGALSQGMLLSVVSHHGFSVRGMVVQDLPRSARSVTDLRNRRIVPAPGIAAGSAHAARGAAADARALRARPQHADGFRRLPRQRVEANYFAAAVLVPEQAAVTFLRRKDSEELSVEDMRDVFSVSYEMAAHRFTNLATHHLDLPCHFVKNNAGGTIYKAYENDGVVFPADGTGAIEGQRMCRLWSATQIFSAADRFNPSTSTRIRRPGTYYCVASIDSGSDRGIRDHAWRVLRRRPLVPWPRHY